jgi:ABC-2 type transport system ATP-binding protein
MAQTVVFVHNLVKSFGQTYALDGFDLHVERGEVHGLLGPDHCGKTTLLRILVGLARPDKSSGPVQVLGADAGREHPALFQRLAYVPTEVALWPHLTGWQTLNLLASLRGLFDDKYCQELVELFTLPLDQPVATFSRTQMQTLVLVTAFASQAELLFLDEPWLHLDRQARWHLTACIRQARSAGRTVILTSRYLGDAERVCDSVTFIKDGRAAQTGRLSEFGNIARVPVALQTKQPTNQLANLPGVHRFEQLGAVTHFTVDTPHLGTVISAAAPLGIIELVCQSPTLGDYFFEQFGLDYAPVEFTQSELAADNLEPGL